ncbi:uncharacterized protein LOC131666606 isoform X1 [Phymastichus coffea]|uniref:uncharacterized protein LOC131666606 isoform X1 n=2 Tax=Phymastichus coffea TaxID=108790 RepID=UPI00273A9CAC|nr:uncharacterized protein LOC131666606 isoform X1 [Phymastichus coffea]
METKLAIVIALLIGSSLISQTQTRPQRARLIGIGTDEDINIDSEGMDNGGDISIGLGGNNNSSGESKNFDGIRVGLIEAIPLELENSEKQLDGVSSKIEMSEEEREQKESFSPASSKPENDFPTSAPSKPKETDKENDKPEESSSASSRPEEESSSSAPSNSKEKISSSVPFDPEEESSSSTPTETKEKSSTPILSESERESLSPATSESEESGDVSTTMQLKEENESSERTTINSTTEEENEPENETETSSSTVVSTTSKPETGTESSLRNITSITSESENITAPSTSSTPQNSTEGSTTPASQNPNTCIGECSSHDSLRYSIYLPNIRCDKFCECSNGRAIVISCPKRLHFNAELNVCDWPDRANCSGIIPPYISNFT